MRTLPRECQRWVIGKDVPVAIPTGWRRLMAVRLSRLPILAKIRSACHEADQPSNQPVRKGRAAYFVLRSYPRRIKGVADRGSGCIYPSESGYLPGAKLP